MIRLVIFDFDDTLIRNDRLDYQGFRVACKCIKCYIPTFVEVKKLRKQGILAKDIIKWIKKKSELNFSDKKFFAIRNKFLQSVESIKFFMLRKKTRAILRKLKSMNMIILIATLRKKKSLIRLFLKKEGIQKYIDDVFAAKKNAKNLRISKNAIKEKERLISKILKKYKIRPTESIMICDSKNDLIAASKNSILSLPIKSEINSFSTSTNKTMVKYTDISKLIQGINKIYENTSHWE